MLLMATTKMMMMVVVGYPIDTRSRYPLIIILIIEWV